MDSCEVLIVGGGPAGSTCAWKLREAGLDVVIIDKEQFPRDKVCAGWITPAVLDALEFDTEEYQRDHVLQQITGFRTGLMGQAEVLTEYGETVSYGIRRREFDDYLLRRSKARLRLGEPLTSMARYGDHWVVNGNLRTPLIIGAGGHFCPVARHLGSKIGRSEVVVAAQEVEFEMPVEEAEACPVAGKTPELYFCPDLKGYGWVFRKGNYLNIGLGKEGTNRLGTEVASFRDYLQRRGRIPQALPARFQGHAYLLHGRSQRKLVDDGVLLIGDAAGLAYPQSGEGIRPAVESALLAAEVVLAAALDYRSDELRGYESRLQQRFGEHSGRSASDWLPPGAKNFIAAKLLGSRLFSRHIVLERWFLHRHEEPLVLQKL